MAKKIIFIALFMMLILAGFLFLTPPGKKLLDDSGLQRVTAVPNNGTKTGLSGSNALETAQSNVTVRQSGSNDPPTPSLVKDSRSARWRSAKSASSIPAQIEQLLSDSDVENPRFAHRLFTLCEWANDQKSSEQMSVEVAKRRLKELENRSPTTDPFARESLILYGTIANSQLSKSTAAKKGAISDSFVSRCGGPMSNELGIKIAKAIDNAGRAGAALSDAAFGDLKSDASFVALDKVISEPTLASVWLPTKAYMIEDAAKSAGYLEGFNDEDKAALTWMVVCNFGGDCADDGTTRLNACLSSHLCEGSSVAESVAIAVGKDKLPIIAARANQIALDLAANGAGFFKPRPK